MRSTDFTRRTAKFNRRDFVRIAAASTGTMLLTACGGKIKQSNKASTKALQQLKPQIPTTIVPHATQGTSGERAVVTARAEASAPPVPRSLKESPQLTKMVNTGQIPKVQDRLPKNPLVLKPVDKVGTYGGDWNMGISGPGDTTWVTRTIGYDNLLRWKLDTRNFTPDEVIPNVAESFEIAEDGKVYTFKLREGMKWSDGNPFTTDDILFWYEDVLSNKELSPGGGPDWLLPGDNSLEVKKIDDYKVTFKFSKPNGLLLVSMAPTSGSAPTNYPSHYMKQFHKKYNPKMVQQAKKLGLEDWTALFGQKADNWGNSDKPTLDAWKPTQSIGKATERFVAERNPYYWKVDTEGNQLPYIDRVTYSIVNREQTMVLKALNGEIDMQTRHINALQNKAVLYKNQKKGNYHFFGLKPCNMNTTIIMLNMNHKNRTLRKVFSNKDFRIGLSYAINRQEIIDTVYVSQGEPYQAAPRSESVFYNERLARQYTEYDVKKANEHLNKALPKKDSQGMRLGPDGKVFSFQVEIAGASPHPEWPDVMSMVKKYWQEVGISIAPKVISRDLFAVRRHTPEVDAVVWQGRGGLEVLLDPKYYFPVTGAGGSNYANAWGAWFQDPTAKDAIKPPAGPRRQMELFRQIQQSVDRKQQINLMKQILEISADQFYCIGLVLPAQGYGVVKNNFYNVPETMLDSWQYPDPAPTNPPQYFIQK